MRAEVPGVVWRDESRAERTGRLAIWVVLVLSWVVAVAYMWDALSTIPSAERLETSRLVEIPTPRTFFAAAIFSALELAVVLAALWPWHGGFYSARLGATALALATWIIVTTPMVVSRMDWVHRRWLAFMFVAVAAAFLLHLAYLLYRLIRKERE